MTGKRGVIGVREYICLEVSITDSIGNYYSCNFDVTLCRCNVDTHTNFVWVLCWENREVVISLSAVCADIAPMQYWCSTFFFFTDCLACCSDTF